MLFRSINPALAGRVAAWKPDVIFLMNYAFLSYCLLLLDPRTWRLPILFRGDSHDVGRQGKFSGRLSKFLRRIIFARFSAFLDVGINNRNYIIASGVPRRKLFHSPHAIDNDRFQAARAEADRQARELRHRLAIEDRQVLIAFVGKLIPIKRPFDLLRAFSMLSPECRHQAALLFVGEGLLKSDLRAASHSHDLKNVHFLDFQNQTIMQIGRAHV